MVFCLTSFLTFAARFDFLVLRQEPSNVDGPVCHPPGSFAMEGGNQDKVVAQIRQKGIASRDRVNDLLKGNWWSPLPPRPYDYRVGF